ncbi:kinase-like domain-containing protein [Xylariaceae sp. FL1272]|nr:kinase-like domain-containing protein [Xylariaceae sp. FL1272]
MTTHPAGLPEFVRESRLQAQILSTLTIHETYDPYTGLSHEETWHRDTDKRLGRGGQGKVWLERCFDAPSAAIRYRAVKEIDLDKPINVDQDRLRELEALAKFSRKKYNVFLVESYGWYLKAERLLCIAMEYCELGDLARHLESRGQLPENEVHAIATQVLGGLSFMHDENWAHRDLKLSNILIMRLPPAGWRIKITDLGLSKRTYLHMYDSTTVKGTPGLLAPELAGFMGAHASRTADPKAIDMWCLGGSIFELITGQKPFADLSLFAAYCQQRKSISEAYLTPVASSSLVAFVRSLMWFEPRSRLTVVNAREHAWIKNAPQGDHSAIWKEPPIPVTNTQISSGSASSHTGPADYPPSASWTLDSSFSSPSATKQTSSERFSSNHSSSFVPSNFSSGYMSEHYPYAYYPSYAPTPAYNPSSSVYGPTASYGPYPSPAPYGSPSPMYSSLSRPYDPYTHNYRPSPYYGSGYSSPSVMQKQYPPTQKYTALDSQTDPSMSSVSNASHPQIPLPGAGGLFLPPKQPRKPVTISSPPDPHVRAAKEYTLETAKDKPTAELRHVTDQGAPVTKKDIKSQAKAPEAGDTSKRRDTAVSQSTIKSVETQVLEDFQIPARQKATVLRPRQKSIKKEDLRAFAASFKLPTPIPADIISLLTNDPKRRMEFARESLNGSRSSYSGILKQPCSAAPTVVSSGSTEEPDARLVVKLPPIPPNVKLASPQDETLPNDPPDTLQTRWDKNSPSSVEDEIANATLRKLQELTQKDSELVLSPAKESGWQEVAKKKRRNKGRGKKENKDTVL